MYNCIYEDGSVVALPMGPCAPSNNGASFVDAYDESTTIDVIEPAPVDAASFTPLGWAILVGVVFLWFSDRRR